MLAAPLPSPVSPEPQRPGRALYVYYRVPTGQALALQARVRAMQATLNEAFPGLQSQLLRRADGPADAAELTWMEVYAHPQGVSAACEEALADAAADLSAWGMGHRHVEVFVSMEATPVARMD
jgi:hypothetical protein